MRSTKLKTVTAAVLSVAIAALLYSVVFVTTPAEASKTPAGANAVVLSEGFDDITTLVPGGWFMQNNSTSVGLTTWFQGNPEVFPSQSGGTNSYIGANFNSTTGASTISTWLLTPAMTIDNGDVLKFWTATGAGSIFPDRLEVRLSTNGASTNVGTGPTAVGDFTTVLTTINPDLEVGGYPETWTEITVTVSGLAGPTTGRIGFRYYVTDAGPSGNNSNYIGIDTLSYDSAGGSTPTPTATPTATPTPTPGGGGDETTYCQTVGTNIPDNSPAGMNSTLTVPDTGEMTQVRLKLVATHSWVGDVKFSLTSPASTSSVVYDRPGVQGSGFGCSGDNINNTVWDLATLAFETDCTSGNPAFPEANYRGGDPAGNVMLPFAGEDMNGTWTLNVSDNAAGDTGSLTEWCLIVNTGEVPTPTPTPPPTPTPTPYVYLYDNGPVKTGTVTGSGVTAPEGFEWSEVANNAEQTNSNTSSGFSCGMASTFAFRCADDFTVPAGETWDLTNTNVIVYQTGVAEPNFTGATLRIWDGPPGVAGSNIIFGDDTTNRFAEARAINAYRIFNTVVNPNTPGTTRSLWEVSINSAVSLSAGTYWVDWSTQIQGNPAHFAPAVTIPNSRTQPGWNARQFDAGTLLDWWDIMDDGSNIEPEPVPQDMPFKLLGSSSGGPSSGSARADFDGDGRTDVSVYRPSEGIWYMNQSTDGFAGAHFGIATDELAPGDFDGDGKTDIAVYRASDVVSDYDMWILRSSDGTLAGGPWGVVGDVAVIGDYDGDGKDDVAVYRESETMWYISYAGVTYDMIPFGLAGDVPVPGDYDGDGKTDVAVFRPSDNTWYVRQSSDTSVVQVVFGDPSDILVPGDYDGDGKTDMATFRPSEGAWYIRNSSDETLSVAVFGTAGDIPAPGDYDGDGKEDVAVVRNGTWWINGSTSGLTVQLFGFGTDKPIPTADRP